MSSEGSDVFDSSFEYREGEFGRMEELLTIEELSGKLKVSKSTIYRWVHYDFIPYIKLSGAVRFDERSVRKWLTARERPGRTRLNIDID